MYTYILVNILTIIFPLLFSFEGKVCFYRKWKYLFPAIFLSAAILIPLDSYFTKIGVWGFTPEYLIGIYIWGLPLEEILFFFCIPYACVFIYEVMIFYRVKDLFKPMAKPLSVILIFVLAFMVFLNLDKIYTAFKLSCVVILLILHLFVFKQKYLGFFYLFYLVTLIPFIIVNGILTNGLSFISSEPVVWYNNLENLDLRVMGIPVEDFVYSLFMLLLNITFYEYLKKKY